MATSTLHQPLLPHLSSFSQQLRPNRSNQLWVGVPTNKPSSLRVATPVRFSLGPDQLFLLDADVGYSPASYYTSLGLFVISVPGLWSLIKRSVKSKIVQKTFVRTEGEAVAPNQMAGEILSFFTRNNFSVSDRGETITRNAGIVLCSSTPSRRIASLRRRDLVLLGLTSSFVLSGPNSDLLAIVSSKQDVKMNMFMDDINAYSFAYPIELADTNSSFKWVESRKPERYSSAAPLSPNARQRIVSERLDMIHNVVITVSIGPPNKTFLTSNDKSTWKAGDVADSVLSDKSALITGQRMVESSILDVHSDNVGDESYWYYEYIVRKSPTTFVQEPNLFRHNLAVTTERDGYLYSLNASTLSKQWEQIGPLLEKTVTSFRLLPPTESYVPPYKDPWRFW